MFNESRFVFVGGAGRSGTTMIQKYLLSHPEISGGPEFYHTRDVFKLYQKFYNHKEALQVYMEGLDLENHFKDFYSSFFKGFYSEDIKVITEKTPTNIEVAHTLLNLYPEALFIYIYRDGRGVVNSHLKVKKRAKKKGKNLTELNLIRTSKYWIQRQEIARQVKEEHPNRFIEIKYEDFLIDPEKHLKTLFSTLEIKNYSEEVLRNKSGDYSRDVHINDIWYTNEMYNSGVNKKKANQWKNDLNILQRFVLNSILFKELKIANYEVSNSYKVFNYVFSFFLNWKEELKSLKVLKPFLYVKRRLQ